jgi:hypothetical protein
VRQSKFPYKTVDKTKQYFEKCSELIVEQHKKFNYLFYGKLIGKIKLNMAQFIHNKNSYFTFPMDKTGNLYITLKL